ncbi:MAG: sulfatase [Myxococcota bacterium]|nr:sulfatase [Myxococcota bacterium]
MLVRKHAVALVVALVLVGFAASVLWLDPCTGEASGRRSHAGLPLPASAMPPCPSCNVLLITVDTVRADYLECFGAQIETMPSVCALAQRGWSFEHAISPAPATLPALTSLLTGQIISNESLAQRLFFFQNRPYAAQLLQEAGYVTAGIVDHPALGTLEAPGRQSGFLHRGFSQFLNHGDLRATDTGDKVSASAVSFLESHARDKFFLWLHYFGPHFPYAPSAKDARRYGFDETRCGRIGGTATIEELRRLTDSVTQDELACVRNLHRAELYRTDAWIAEVLGALDTLGLSDKTLVVLTGDHGEEFLERGRFGHEATVFEELVHVPFVAVHPKTQGARRVLEPVSTAAVFDIIAGILAQVPLRFDREVLTRTHHDYMDRGTVRMRSEPNSFALYESNLKAVIPKKEEPLVVYDLEQDKGEKRPLAPDAPALGELAARLEAFVSAPVEVSVPENTDLRELLRLDFQRLENLGYFE